MLQIRTTKLDKIDRRISHLYNEVKNISAMFKDFENQLNNIATHLESHSKFNDEMMEKFLTNFEHSVGAMCQEAINSHEMSRDFENLNKNIDTKIKPIASSYDKIKNSVISVERSIADAHKEIDGTHEVVKNITKHTKSIDNKFEALSSSSRETKQSINSLDHTVGAVTYEIKEIHGYFAKMDTNLMAERNDLRDQIEKYSEILDSKLEVLTRSSAESKKSVRSLDLTVEAVLDKVKEIQSYLAKMDTNIKAEQNDLKDQIALCITEEKMNAVINQHIDRGMLSAQNFKMLLIF